MNRPWGKLVVILLASLVVLAFFGHINTFCTKMCSFKSMYIIKYISNASKCLSLILLLLLNHLVFKSESL